MRSIDIAIALALSLFGCGSLQFGAEATAPADDPVAPPAESSPAESTPMDAGLPDASCPTETDELLVFADTAIMVDPNACPGDLSYGASDGLNAFVGAAALRFQLPAADVTAFAHMQVVAVSLLLDTHQRCSGCGGAGLPAIAGQLAAHAMRSDWDEGKATGKTGADGCRRTAGLAGWGTASVSTPATRIAAKADYADVPAGVVRYADAALLVEVPLSAEAIADYRLARHESTSEWISFFVVSDAQIVFASKETGGRLRAARLRITRCI